jgi:hypothetical protein
MGAFGQRVVCQWPAGMYVCIVCVCVITYVCRKDCRDECFHAHIHVCMYVCMYVYMYIYMYRYRIQEYFIVYK